MITRLATDADITGILDLQAINLYSNLTDKERENGFVTTPFTTEQIQTLLHKERSVFVAEENSDIVGYAFAGSWDFFSQWAIFPYMVSRFGFVQFHGASITSASTFQYGPVCIAHDKRGSGLFPQLFGTMRQTMSERYPVGLTFINRKNSRSVKAHTTKLDLEIVDEFDFNGNQYYGLAFWT